MSQQSYIIPQILSRVAAKLYNDALQQDSTLKPLYQRLQHKSLKLTLRYPSIAWRLDFGAKAITISPVKETDPVDCEVILSASSLLKLHDPQQLMRLLQSDAIEIIGDLKVIQTFTLLLELVHWDVTDYLTPYFGDIGSQFLATQGKRILRCVTKRSGQAQQDLKLAISQEWQLCPNSPMVADLYNNIEKMNQRLLQLEQKISVLERRQCH